jgi:hypothetical protein
MTDLNTDLLLVDAFDINDRAEIAGEAVLPNGDIHAVLLVPCHKGETGCVAAAHIAAVRSIISDVALQNLKNSPDWFPTPGVLLTKWRLRTK